MLVPGLGVVATMAGDGDIIVTDRRGRADRYQSAETPNLDDDSLQHDEGSHRILSSSMTVSGLRRRGMWNLAPLNSG